MKKKAAIILCAGKGTRMNDASKNKVCFRCAGIPVIRRIVDNMRLAGINLFVIVVGYRATDVMKCLDGEEGVVYAFQKKQLGTGHAALCGLKALSAIGYEDSVIISMGDMVVASDVVRQMLRLSQRQQAVCAVQSVAYNRSGGRIVMRKNKLYGIVEFADAASMAVSDLPLEQRAAAFCALGMSLEKANRLVEINNSRVMENYCVLNGEVFTAKDILEMPYVNTALYSFPIKEIVKALLLVKRDNAQNELYLTDGIEFMARKGKATVLKIDEPEKMLTYSTKDELSKIDHFLRKQ